MLRNLALATTFLLASLGFARAQQSFPGGPDPMVCTYNATLPTLASGQTGFVQCDANGRLLSPGGGGTITGTVAPTPGTCTDTPKPLNSTSSTLLPAGTYKSVAYMNIGTNPMTFVEGTAAAVVGNGMALNGAASAGLQGSTWTYPTPPTNAVQAISPAGTTVIVKVCN